MRRVFAARTVPDPEVLRDLGPDADVVQELRMASVARSEGGVGQRHRPAVVHRRQCDHNLPTTHNSA